MADTRGITVKVLTPLHSRVKEEQERLGVTMSQYIQDVLNEHFYNLDRKEEKNMGAARTIAFQVPEEFFMRVKDHLNKTGLSQKDFFINLAKAEIERFEMSKKQRAADNGTEFDDSGEDMDEDSQNTAVVPQEDEQEEGQDSDETPSQSATKSGFEDEDENEDENEYEDQDEDEDENEYEDQDEDEDQDLTIAPM